MSEIFMEFVNNDLIPTLLNLLGLAIGTLITVAIAKFVPVIKNWVEATKANLDAKLGEELSNKLVYTVREFIIDAVKSAEQKFGAKTGGAKRAYVVKSVVEICNKLNINVPEEYIDIVLESTCARLFPNHSDGQTENEDIDAVADDADFTD